MNVRLIARLDVKAPYLIKGVHLEGLRKVGDPREFAERYYKDGIDEILYIDAVASLYRRNTITDLVKRTAENVFIPITAGGGVRSVDDVRTLLRVGADKVAINTAAVRRPELITEVARALGSQCMVLSIQAKRQGDRWEAYCDQGREHTGMDALHRELALIKIRYTAATKQALLKLAKKFRASVINETDGTLIVEQTGATEELDEFEALVKKYGVIEMVRSGKLVMAKSKEPT